jgi:hypothetical protein
LDEVDQRGQGHHSSMVPVDLRNDCIELETILFDELLSELLNGTVVLDLFLEQFGDLAFAAVAENFISGKEATAYARTLHVMYIIWVSIGEVEDESRSCT